MKNIAKVTISLRRIARADTAVAASMQTFLAKVLILVGNVVTGIITARTLGPEGRGELAAMMMWSTFLAYTLTFGLPSALLFNLKRYPSKKREYFSAALLLSLLLGFVAMLIGIIFIPIWLGQYSEEVIRFSQWLMLLSPSTLVATILVATLEAENEFTKANQFSYFCSIAAIPILLILWYLDFLNTFSAALAYTLSTVPIFLWILIYVCKKIGLTKKSLLIHSQSLLNYGIRSYGIDLLGTLASKVDQILVVGLLAPSAMGMYVVALSLSRLLNMFHSSIVTVLFPKAAGKSLNEVVSLASQVARVNLILETIAGTSVIIFAPLILGIMYGPRFAEAIPVFQILVAEIILSGTSEVLAQSFMALGKPEIVTLSQGIGLGLSIPLMLLLIPRLGLEGVGLALLVSTLVRLIVIILCYPMALKVNSPKLMPRKKDLIFLINAFKSQSKA